MTLLFRFIVRYREDSLNDTSIPLRWLSDEFEVGIQGQSMHRSITDDTTVHANNDVIQEECKDTESTEIGEEHRRYKAAGITNGKVVKQILYISKIMNEKVYISFVTLHGTFCSSNLCVIVLIVP